jgi:serine/threonine protein kinase
MYILCNPPYEYLSPEEILNINNGMPLTSAKMTNMWKIGVVAYELAYGIPPFSIQELVYTIVRDEKLTLKYPWNNAKSAAFQDFLRSIFRKNP